MALKSFLSPFFSKTKKTDKDFKSWIKTTTGYTPKNLIIYHQAFMHSSMLGSKKKTANLSAISNERLEFLGDAVLGSVIAEYLFTLYPTKNEGFLTQLRSKLVNGQHLKKLALKFGFNTHLKTKLNNNERSNSSAYGDAFEAFVGAMYLDLGYEKTKKFIIKRVLKLHVDLNSLANNDTDYKSQLQILCQKNKWQLEYRLLNEVQQGAKKIYTVQVLINEKEFASFEHFSKRVAEQKAAELSLQEINTSSE